MKRNSGLKGIALSLVLHSFLLLPLLSWNQSEGLGKTSGPVAAMGGKGEVNLAGLQLSPPPPPMPKPKPAKPKKKGPAPKKKEAKKPPPSAARQPTAAASSQGENARLGGETGSAGKLALAAIRSQLERGLIYPANAQDKGLEGRVMVSFLLSKQGEISNIRIKDGSGHMLLDRAALLTLRRMRLALDLDKSMQITLPILFALR